MSIILGLSGGFIHRAESASASLIINGKLEFSQEEERINRIKNSRGLLPTYAIREALNFAKIKITDVDYVAYCFLYPDLAKKLKSYFKFNFGYCPKLKFVDHHTSHAYSAYFPSKFKKSNIITFDYSGNGISTTINYGEGKSIKRLRSYKKPNSLGIFYGLITQALGFELDNDEYKVMGLASYGKPIYNFENILKIKNDGYQLNEKIINQNEKDKKTSLSLTRQEAFYDSYLLKQLNLKHRMPKQVISTKKKNIAASAQYQLNLAAEQLFKYAFKITGINNFCLAGGVALNCTMNKYLSNLDFVENFFVQPASSDAGCSMGAALYVANKMNEKITIKENFYLGNKFGNKSIKKILNNNNILKSAKKFNVKFIARELAKSKIVAIFQGRHEFGPRALGNRSILANPKNNLMKKILNQKIKYREGFRPFAPVVLDKHSKNYFYLKSGVDYSSMTVTCHAKPNIDKKIPSCIHYDNTARVQVLKRKKNKKLESILEEFGKLTGDPVLINTSFNLNKQPNVNTPEDAIATFYSSGIDYLILEDYILCK